LTFQDPDDFSKIQPGDHLQITHLRSALQEEGLLKIENVTQKRIFEVSHGLNSREREILLAGGLLNYTRKRRKG
jgi:aconitate hydratase